MNLKNFFIAAGVEFLLAAIITSALGPLTTSRLALVSLSLICGAVALFIGLSGRVQTGQALAIIQKQLSIFKSITLLILLGGLTVFFSPDRMWQEASVYIQLLRPVLLVISILPMQAMLPWFIQKQPQVDLFERNIIFIFAGGFILLIFICISKIGIHADPYFWNVAGVPVTFFHLLPAFLSAVILLMVPGRSGRGKDAVIVILLFVIGVSIWSQTAMVKNFFSPRPSPPAYQYFPFSDAQAHDLGAISILNGQGIYFGGYTDKPLYMVFLAVLHLFTGDDYNALSMAHLIVMGLLIPAAYWFGKKIHSHALGITLATLLILRQQSALYVSHLFSGTNPRLLITEIPTLIGLIIFCALYLSWSGKNPPQPREGWAMLSGGILGALALVRLNPLLLMPVVLIFFALTHYKNPAWKKQTLLFFLCFTVVFSPWVLTGRDEQGQPYLITKVVNVMRVRFQRWDIFPAPTPAPRQTPVSRLRVRAEEDIVPSPPVLNHTLHNLVTSFLILPDSLLIKDQDVVSLIERPYFNEKSLYNWNGEVEPIQIPFILLNLYLLALGVFSLWKRHGWGGILPLVILFSYAFTLGLARSSGSRYIVPVDWIVLVYYLAGIFEILSKFTSAVQNDPPQTGLLLKISVKSFYTICAAVVLLLALPVPLTQLPRLSGTEPVCDNRIYDEKRPNLRLYQGTVLYPMSSKDSFHFVFFSCNVWSEIEIKGLSVPLQQNQQIIVGFADRRLLKPYVIESDGRIIWHSQWFLH